MRRRLGAALALVVALSACGDDGGKDDVDADQARASLEGQRTQVRALAVEVAPLLADAVAGSPAFANGEWQGCDTANVDFEYRNFHYSVSGRLDAGAGARRPFTGALSSALSADGFEVSVSGHDLSATKGELRVTAREYADQEFVLFGVSGPCVDVPEDERGAWDTRQEPSPDVLAGEPTG